jgi:hypothetical protein
LLEWNALNQKSKRDEKSKHGLAVIPSEKLNAKLKTLFRQFRWSENPGNQDNKGQYPDAKS